MKNELPFRQVHLDFHTSEHIPDLGSLFDPDEFARTLVEANVNSITLFARGHHGWAYYPSKLFAPHPNLQRPDLLGEMIRACHDSNIATPIYITVQWDNKIAHEHPEWRMVEDGNSDFSPFTPRWHTLCINHRDYQNLVIDNSLEVISLYPEIEGLFFDIVLGGSNNQCLCNQCLADMQKSGLNPEIAKDRSKHYFDTAHAFMQKCSVHIWEKNPHMRIIYNSGHLFKGRNELLESYSHFELESLPTGGWGYDHFPISAAYVSTKSKKFLGMTGKFHTSWGEFGGFKRPEALEYETAQIVAMGGRCSIGDQLHPSGRIDRSTYKLIGNAYAKIKNLEPYLENTRPVADIAILSEEAIGNYHDGLGYEISENQNAGNLHDYAGDYGAARMLLQEHQTSAVIDALTDFSAYKVIILPDTITIDTFLAEKIHHYMRNGGMLIASAVSGMDTAKKDFFIDLGLQSTGEFTQFAPNYMQINPEMASWDAELWESPFVMYHKSCLVRSKKNDIKVISTILNPYFQRSWRHFCSHQHTPYSDNSPSEDSYGAVFAASNWVYFAHPIFAEFYQPSQPLLKYLFRGALGYLNPDRRIKTNLPSAVRVFINDQEAEGRILIHLLYASIRKQGDIEIIEDRITLSNIELQVLLEGANIQRIFIAQSNEDLGYEIMDKYVHIFLPEFTIHSLVVIQLA